MVEGDKIVSISFSGSSVSDKDLWVLKELPDVRSLSLGGTQVGDAGIKYVKFLKKLERLDLYRDMGNYSSKTILIVNLEPND